MQSSRFNLILKNHSDTENLGRLIAGVAGPGLCILLEGDIGAGKTYLARCIIQTLLAKDGFHEDVPSPTFTLVQVYETGSFETWHADLYRLGSPDEILELGLEDAFEQAFCLIEWPDRMGELAPENAVRLSLSMTDQPEHRLCEITVPSGPLADALATFSKGETSADRSAQRAAFLAKAGWAKAGIAPVAGDASNRRYDRLTKTSGSTAILMDAGSKDGENVTPFLKIAAHLIDHGLSAPKILHKEIATGLVLMEDFGDGLIARIVANDASKEAPLYKAAIDTLIALQTVPVTPELPRFDAPAMRDAAMLPAEWYLGRSEPLLANIRAAYAKHLTDTLAQLSSAGPVLIHRDFHVENLIWLPEREGSRRIGLLDFQDAMVGHPAYDLASLLSDARRDVTAKLRYEMMGYFADQTGSDIEILTRDLAILSVQRNLRILGVFARLCLRDGKTQYAKLAPRVWNNLLVDLDHPDLEAFGEFIRQTFAKPVWHPEMRGPKDA